MASRDPNRPNILFVLTDDQGFWAMGCAGNPEIRTLALDRLAETPRDRPKNGKWKLGN